MRISSCQKKIYYKTVSRNELNLEGDNLDIIMEYVKKEIIDCKKNGYALILHYAPDNFGK